VCSCAGRMAWIGDPFEQKLYPKIGRNVLI
jgi:hypothetical protein